MKRTLFLIPSVMLLAACSQEPSQSVDQNDLNEAVDSEATAQLEQTLMESIGRISEQQSANVEGESLNELQQLSEEDRAALRALAEVDLMQSAEKEAAEQAQKESDYRVTD